MVMEGLRFALGYGDQGVSNFNGVGIEVRPSNWVDYRRLMAIAPTSQLDRLPHIGRNVNRERRITLAWQRIASDRCR